MDRHDKHVDEFTGVETTGHEWDGIRELNNPLPRWWLWIFYASVIWSIAYWVAMPAWPLVSGYTKGMLGWSQRQVVQEEIADARAAQGAYLERIKSSSLEQIRTDRELLDFAMAGGEAAFAVNCSQCHGSGAQGFPGYPNLNDDEWLWGGSVEAIHATITHGIRNEKDPDARFSQMPAFLTDGILAPEQVTQVANYVLELSGEGAADPSLVGPGADIFAEQCVACHGENGEGNNELGAPALNNRIWLYGGDMAALTDTIRYSRGGVMPAWGRILDDVTVKQLAVYVHSLGGGQ